MRIEALSTLVAVVWLTAVLCPRLIAANNLTLSSFRSFKGHSFKGHISDSIEPLEESMHKRMTYREMQMILREEGENGHSVDCCPSVEEMVQPRGGRTREDMYIPLFQQGENVQRFFEYSCRADVLNKPCRFVDRKFSNQSRCVQKYSYTYAIVQNSELEHRRHKGTPQYQLPVVNGSGWALDYIRVRSGCSCEIMPKPKKKKIAATKARRAKSKQRHPRDQESDFET